MWIFIFTAIVSLLVTIAVVRPEFLFYVFNPGALVYLCFLRFVPYQGPSNEGSLIDFWVKSISITIAMWIVAIITMWSIFHV